MTRLKALNQLTPGMQKVKERDHAHLAAAREAIEDAHLGGVLSIEPEARADSSRYVATLAGLPICRPMYAASVHTFILGYIAGYAGNTPPTLTSVPMNADSELGELHLWAARALGLKNSLLSFGKAYAIYTAAHQMLTSAKAQVETMGAFLGARDNDVDP